MLEKATQATAWKATEWLIRRVKSRDEAQEILAFLRLVLENPTLWPAVKAVVEAIKKRDFTAALKAADALANVWKG